MLLDEVPGALERPGDCRIEVYEDDDSRAVTIVVPSRPLPWILMVGAVLLTMNLIVIAYTGVMLFAGHKSVLVMSQIAPHDLTPPLRRWVAWLAVGWIVLEGLGVLMLAVTVRPALLRESIRIDPEGVSRLREMLGRRTAMHLALADIRGFHLERDPQHLVVSTLSVETETEMLPIAENATEADREWLHSVGNALLRRL